MTPQTDTVKTRSSDLNTVIKSTGKYELYYDLDGTVNARIAESWVKRQWRWGYFYGCIAGVIANSIIKGFFG